ncbi:G-alpha-domain-containing protein [Vararia minispora EC-137]|uniref:G-alpha-domain-containing protein n=1 Tax=Vararia minispora EC-137 TaxID=1314806 RepID=A0ACB8QL98_9AGAM|nr:G-alpha-domain-containing protein [Vararia minispora EC-137]
MVFSGHLRAISPRTDNRSTFQSPSSPSLTNSRIVPSIVTSSVDLDNEWPLMSPIENETGAQRERRLEAEREAKCINDAIEHEIEQDRAERKRHKPEVKILLLGQAESGKSTMLRNFQLKFTPTAFAAERAAWRAVIDLNIVRSVRYILDVLASAPAIPEELRRLRVALSPLRSVEEALAIFLASDEHGRPVARPADEHGLDVKVRGSRWKTLFNRSMTESTRQYTQAYEEVLNARRIIEACRDDLVALWAHPAVKENLEGQSVPLQFQSGFFLDQVGRIASSGYEPSSDDVLKARIQTQGVEEHLLKMETAAESGQTWAIVDVGGNRHQRAAWIPYFDDVNMLLFLAPVSAFDQTLAEDSSVNRLWDSFLIWRTVCSSKLLRDVSFILLLNKYDILDAKLKSGIQFASHVTSYKRRPNETEAVLTYLKEKFVIIFRQATTNNRPLHVHYTCATDSRATAIVLARIREVILTGNFMNADLL